MPKLDKNVFDFGVNWSEYSNAALDESRFDAAKQSLFHLFGKSSFQGLTFLDVGCGSGIFSIAAKKWGAAEVKGIDISSNSIETCIKNAKQFSEERGTHFEELSVLDKEAMTRLKSYDLVYAWGSLHHTGRMWEAIAATCQKVNSGGTLTLGIYNKHWTSPIWSVIKIIYNRVPRFLQKGMIGIFYPVIYVSKWAITRENPHTMRRGMDFYYDVVDWIGGYPYEYASVEEIKRFVEPRGFTLEKVNRAHLPTGNNEFVFKKTV